MQDVEIITDIPSREDAELRRRFFAARTPPWTAQVIEEPDGEFSVIAMSPAKLAAMARSAVEPSGKTSASKTDAALPSAGNVLARCRPLLDLIAQVESGGNDNAFFGNAANKTDPQFTAMSVDEVLDWQRKRVKLGAFSAAAGRYQIITKTLRGLKDQLGLAGSETFDRALQDRMAVALLRRRELDQFLLDLINPERFGNNLAREWASFPVMTGPEKGRSFFAGDGVNKALIAPERVLATLAEVSGA